MSCEERIAILEAQLRNTEHQLTAYRDKIDKDDLVRCLRAARDSYRGETYQLKNRIAELEEDNDELRDDVLRLEAMLRAYKQRQLEVAA
jgi:hypothetical protein